MRLRTGRKVGRTIYLQAGEEPSDDDRLVGLLDTPELAELVVASTNYCFPNLQPDLGLPDG